jgi:hypothetical protein
MEAGARRRSHCADRGPLASLVGGGAVAGQGAARRSAASRWRSMPRACSWSRTGFGRPGRAACGCADSSGCPAGRGHLAARRTAGAAARSRRRRSPRRTGRRAPLRAWPAGRRTAGWGRGARRATGGGAAPVVRPRAARPRRSSPPAAAAPRRRRCPGPAAPPQGWRPARAPARPAQLRPGGIKVQPAGLQQRGGGTAAVPQQPEQQVLTGHAGMTELAGLGEGQLDHRPAVRGQPQPHPARPVVTGRGAHHPGHPPLHQGSLRLRRTRSPCL